MKYVIIKEKGGEKMAGSCGYPHEHCVGDLKCFDCRGLDESLDCRGIDESRGDRKVTIHDNPKDLSQENKFLLISTPAGGKYIGLLSDVVPLLQRNITIVGMNGGGFGIDNICVKIYARKVGEQEKRHHFVPLLFSDISAYVEQAPETEPVGCATVEEPSFEKPPFEVSGP